MLDKISVQAVFSFESGKQFSVDLSVQCEATSSSKDEVMSVLQFQLSSAIYKKDAGKASVKLWSAPVSVEASVLAVASAFSDHLIFEEHSISDGLVVHLSDVNRGSFVAVLKRHIVSGSVDLVDNVTQLFDADFQFPVLFVLSLSHSSHGAGPSASRISFSGSIKSSIA